MSYGYRGFGSLDNALAGSSQAVPAVGMGVTILSWTDRDAGTITWVSASGKSFRFREDKATRSDSNGMSESQSYAYEPDPNAPERTARKTKKGWRDKGQKVVIGYRDAYHDYSF